MKKFLLVILLAISFCAAGKRYKNVVLETSVGKIKLALFEDTPLHSENFLKLVEAKHYDGTLFHRVINEFMIQGGASDSKGAGKGEMLGMKGLEYTIPAEIIPEHCHVKGALAAARQGNQVNPEKKSSGEQFYIVQGKVYTDEELDMIEISAINKAKKEIGMKLLEPKRAELDGYVKKRDKAKIDSIILDLQIAVEEQFEDALYRFSDDSRNLYKTIGGAPFLDREYTVFGEVVEGMDVIDKIAAQKTNKNDRPEEDIMILKAYTTKK